MKDIWLTVSELRNLWSLSERAIRKKIQRGELEAKIDKSSKMKGRRGRKGWLVKLGSCPIFVQMRYLEQINNILITQNGDINNICYKSENTGVTEQKWVSTEEVMLLMKVSKMTVVRWIQEGKLRGRKVKSARGRGGRWEIDVESLPEGVKKAIDAGKKVEEKKEMRGWEEFRLVSEKKREVALARLQAVELWEAEGRDYQKYIYIYRNSEKCASLRKILGKEPSVKTLYRWRKEYDEAKEWTGCGLLGLVPQYGGGKEKLTEQDKKLILRLAGDQNQPSLKKVYDDFVGMTNKKISYMTVKRYWDSLPGALRDKLRRGEKFWRQRYEPYLNVDREKMRSNDVWEADHKQIPVAVRGADGRVVFPWVTFWMDERSRKLLSFAIGETPNTEMIMGSFREAVLKWGLPKKVRVDNGRDFRSKQFTGGYKRVRLEVDEVKLGGLLGELGVEVSFCEPYRAQSKVIERQFRTLNERFAVEWESYRGINVENKPERLQEVIKRGNLPTLVELGWALEAWMEEWYNRRVHLGLGGKSPNEVWEECLIEKREVSEEQLDLFMYAEVRKVGRNGVEIFGLQFYADELWRWKGRKVLVRYDPANLLKVKIYSLQGEFICEAEHWAHAEMGMTVSKEEIERVKRARKKEREAIRVFEQKVMTGEYGLRPMERLIKQRREQMEEDGVEDVGVQEVRGQKEGMSRRERLKLVGDDGFVGRRKVEPEEKLYLFESDREMDEEEGGEW